MIRVPSLIILASCALRYHAQASLFRSAYCFEGGFYGACSNCRYNNGGSGCTSHCTIVAALFIPAKPRSAGAKLQVPKLRKTTRKSQRADELLKNGRMGERREERR